MAIHQLKQSRIDRAKAPGLLSDGGGLNLQVAAGGSKSWIFRYARDGVEHRIGLGSALTVNLDEAREMARQQRHLLLRGLDPKAEKRRSASQRAQAQRSAEARAKTFAECAGAFIAANGVQWRNPKHRAQWHASLSTYAYPVFGDVSVANIDTPLVLKALSPIWNTKTETASRVRGRIERVLAWATTHGYRSGDNPAKWRGHLETALAKPSAVATPEHHAALDFRELPAFLQALRHQQGIAALALEYLILCAARTGEVTGAQWREIDEQWHVWTIPGTRMKAKVEHRVPLSAAARHVIERMGQVRVRGNRHIFPGIKDGAGLSNMAMLTLLRRMGRSDITVHGFRAAFKTWASERTNYPNRLIETALAHQLEDKAEKAYVRTDLLEKRRRLMNDWAKFCNSPAVQSDNVINLREAATG